jgi:hypothetical protein
MDVNLEELHEDSYFKKSYQKMIPKKNLLKTRYSLKECINKF